MKTIRELEEWCDAIYRAGGEPSEHVCQLFFRWSDKLSSLSGELQCAAEDGRLVRQFPQHDLHRPSGVFLLPGEFPLSVPIQTGDPQVGENGVEIFGADPIAPGLWTLLPSLNMPGILHAFVVLYGVPTPPPWEKRIIVPDRQTANLVLGI